jgi:hypothetical protein
VEAERKQRAVNVESHVEILAALLEDHLNLLEEINRYISFIASLDSVKEDHISPLLSRISDLSTLRSTLLNTMSRAVEAARSVDPSDDSIGDLYALIMYYAEAGSHRESEVLRRAERFVDVSRELEEVERASKAARGLAEEVESLRG